MADKCNIRKNQCNENQCDYEIECDKCKQVHQQQQKKQKRNYQFANTKKMANDKSAS